MARLSSCFDPSDPATGPFPADYLTTPNSSQKTGLNINLPLPDCTAQPSECAVVGALNELDGFALQPRIVVNCSAAIDPTTLRTGIVFAWLDNLTSDEKGLGPSGQLTGINQVVYDPATNPAYAKPDDFFDQHRRYALVVTDGVLDTAGNPVGADPQFTACLQSPSNSYCTLLQQTVSNLSNAALPGKIVAASVFTTMSATAWLEQARDLLPQIPVGFQSAGASVKTAGITAISLKAQVGDNPAAFQTFTLQIPASVSLDGVDRMVFGTYQSPNFLNGGQYISATPTAAGLSLAPVNTLSFHAYIPSSTMPPNGYPVHAGSAAPALFQWGVSKYALATRYPDNAFVGNPSLGAGYVAATPGDILILWGTGFGVSQPVDVTLGGIPVTVIGAALSPGLVGVWQVAIQLPNSLPAGDTLLKAIVAGLNTPGNVYLYIN